MEFFRQEYWRGLPFASLGLLPNPGIEPGSPALQADALLPEPPGKPPVLASDFPSTAWPGPLKTSRAESCEQPKQLEKVKFSGSGCDPGPQLALSPKGALLESADQ